MNRIKYESSSAMAREFGMCPTTFFRVVESDKNFPCYQIGKKKKFIRSEVMAYITKGKRAPN